MPDLFEITDRIETFGENISVDGNILSLATIVK